MHSHRIGCIHEELRHAHKVLNGLELQAQKMAVYCMSFDGLKGGEVD